jgi:hypothetical protein
MRKIYVHRFGMAACLVVAGVLSPASQAQDACTALINHGIYDFGRNFNSTVTSTTVRSSVCSAYNSLNQSSSANSGGISVLSFGGASASISNQALTAIGSSLCNNSVSLNNDSTVSNSYSEVIDPAILSAYNQCVVSSRSGLNVNTGYDEVNNSELSIDLSFRVPGANATTFARGVVISSLDPDPNHAVTCVGPLTGANGPNGLAIGNNDIGMVCSRYVVADPSNAFLIAGRSDLAAPVTVTVFTDAGTVTRTLAELSAPPAQPASNVISSSLGTCSRTGSLQICWGPVNINPANPANTSYRTYEIDFPEPFSSLPTITATGTSPTTFAWVLSTVDPIRLGAVYTGAKGYISPAMPGIDSSTLAAAFASVPGMTYVAVGLAGN